VPVAGSLEVARREAGDAVPGETRQAEEGELKVAEWFAAKRYGVGAGLPIRWQGWLLTIGYIALVICASFLLFRNLLALFAIVIPATTGFIIITARTTRGGWRWRWGDKD